MDIQSLNDNIKAKMAEVSALIKSEGKSAIADAMAGFFAKYPSIESVVWTQYTPYFNDGEPCEFGLGEFAVVGDLKSLGLKSYEDDNENNDYYEEGYPTESSCTICWSTKNETAKDIKGFLESLESLDDQVYLAVFGDHVRVVANRDGTFEVDEYDHD